MPDRTIHTLIVDDEALARERLRILLEYEADIDVVRECSDGPAAVAAIQELRPDLVFLDIQMPGMDGFDVLCALEDNIPIVVFATAFDEFAIRAFESNAVDYLLKPVSPERLRSTISRVRQRLEFAAHPGFCSDVMEKVPGVVSCGGAPTRLVVREGSRFKVLSLSEVVSIEAMNNIVRIHTKSTAYPHRVTMAQMEGSLPSAQFLRIHRGIIINIEHVDTIEPWGALEYLFTMSTGAKLTSSRRQRYGIRRTFGI